MANQFTSGRRIYPLEKRRESKLKMAELLRKHYPLTVKDVLRASADGASIHEIHLIAPLAAMGYNPTVCGELLKQLIGKKGRCYVPIQYPDVWETVRAIRDAGGLAVLAHPEQFDSLPLAREMAEKGMIDGIECFHPRNDRETTECAQPLCKEYDLLVTGGSDFHGMYSAKPCPLGSYTICGSRLDRFLEAVEAK
jgi:predicted metal-dependent phosphoesterase TrpH